MRLRRALLALPLLAALGGCEAKIPEGRFACESDEDCPPGLVCRPERARCYETRSDPEPRPDGG